MILMTLNQTLSPGLEQWQYFHSSQVDDQGQQNYAGIANPVVDHLLDTTARRAKTRDEQVAAGTRPGPGAAVAALQHSQLVPQLSPPGVPQPVRLRHHAALHPGPERVVAEVFGEELDETHQRPALAGQRPAVLPGWPAPPRNTP